MAVAPAAVDYRAVAREAAKRHGIDPDLFERQIQRESSFNPRAVSPKGARGIAQFTPDAAREAGVDPDDPVASLDSAAKRMRGHLDEFKSPRLALAAYNAGAGAVRSHGGVPPYPETQEYVGAIMPKRDIADLGRAVKKKFPGVYDKFDDADLGRRAKRKWQKKDPNAYADFGDVGDVAPTSAASAPPVSGEVSPSPSYASVTLPPLGDWNTERQPVAEPQADVDRRRQIAVMRAFPNESPEIAESRMQTFERQNPLVQAGLRFGKGVMETLPSVDDAPGGRTSAIPQASNTGQRLLEGAGGAVTFGVESAALAPVLGPIAAASVPAALQAGTPAERLIRGGVMGPFGMISQVAAPAAKAVAGAIGEHAVGPAAFGVAAPWVEAYSHKILGDKKAEWPTAQEMAESVGLLVGIGAGGHLAGKMAERGMAAGKPEVPGHTIPPEKAAAFQAIQQHLADPGVAPGTTDAEAMRLRNSAAKVTDEANRQLRDQTIRFQWRDQTVTGRVAYVRVYPYPGEAMQLRIVVQDPATGQMVPFAFRDVNAMRRAMARTPEARAAAGQEAAKPTDGPAATPESARSGYLRLTQPGVPEALVEHHGLGRDLHPVAADARDRALGELSGVVKSSEIRDLARSSRDGDAFRERLAALVESRIGGVVPRKEPSAQAEGTASMPPSESKTATPEPAQIVGAPAGGVVAPPRETAPEPEPATRSEVDIAEGRGEGAAPRGPAVVEEPPAPPVIEAPKPEPKPKPKPTHEEIDHDEAMEHLLADPKARKELERMAAGGATDEELHGFIARELEKRGVVLADTDPEPAPVPIPAGPEGRGYERGQRLRIPYQGRSRTRTGELGIFEGYTDRDGERHVIVRVHKGTTTETRVLPESQVRRAVRRVVSDRVSPARRNPALAELVRSQMDGDPEKAREAVELAEAARDRLYEKALELKPADDGYRETRHRLHKAEETLAVTREVAYQTGWEPEVFSGNYPGPGEGDFLRYESKMDEGGAGEAPRARSVAGLADLLRKRIGIPKPEEASGEESPRPTEGGVPGGPSGSGGSGPGLGEPRGGDVAGARGETIDDEGWKPNVVEARGQHSQSVDERVIPEEYRDKLYPHQRQATAKMIGAMVNEGGGLLASGTGAGKTRIELVVAEKLRRLGRAVLIVTPAQVIKQDWTEGSFHGDFLPSSKALGIQVKLWNEKYGEQLEGGKIYITTLEQVHNIAPSDNLALILDESHKFKNPSAKRTQKMLKLIDRAHSVLAASATPKDNINNLHYLVRSGILEGGTFAEMVNRLGLRLVMSNISRPLNEGEKIEIGDRVRFEPNPGLAFPKFAVEGEVWHAAEDSNGEMVYTVKRQTKGGLDRTFMLTERMGVFKKFERGERIVPQSGVTAEQVNARQEQMFDRLVGVGRMVRHEISLHGVPIHLITLKTPVDVRDSMDRLEGELTDGMGTESLPRLAKARVKMALRRQLEHLKAEKVFDITSAEIKRGRQVIVFADRVNETTPNKFVKQWVGGQMVTVKVPLTEFTTPGTMGVLKDRFTKAGMKVGEIHGGLTRQAQLDQMNKFQHGELDVIVGTAMSGGTGIDLHHALEGGRPRTLVLMTSPFDAMNYTQAVGRVLRLGARSKPAVVVTFFDHPIDSWNRDIIAKKMEDLGATVRGELPKLIEGQAGGEPVPQYDARMSGGGKTPARLGKSSGRGISVVGAARIPTPAETAALPEAQIPPIAGGGATKETALERVAEAAREVVAIANPVRLALGKRVDILMAGKGSIEKATFRTERTQEKLRSWWEHRSREQVMDFFDRFETGRAPAPGLEAVDEMYRQRADNMFKALSRYKDLPYWENWFAHLWKNEKKAREFFMARRPMEGNKSFLKKRVFSDYRAGIEGGLEPLSWNPEEIMQSAEHNARKFVVVQELVKDYVAAGLMKLVRVGQKPPDGFRRVDQNWATLYLDPNIAIKEYWDKQIMDGLTKVADDLGIQRDRRVGIGGRRLGYSEARQGSVGKVTTRFATPESVLAHEIGHQIDAKYGLQDSFVRRASAVERAELRDLADLRADQAASAGFKKYIRSGPEKMAVMLEALIHAPEAFRRVAPRNYAKFVDFLKSKPELAALAGIRPSLMYGEGEGSVRAGGIVTGGHYWADEGLARILDNHMSRDLINETRIGRSAMVSRNTLSAMQLGLSGFHATSVAILSIAHRMSVGLSDVAHGRIPEGSYKMFTAPIAPMLYVRDGWRFYRGDPEMMRIENDLFTGGARMRRLEYYKNAAFDRFVTNARHALGEETPYRRLGHATKAAMLAPFAAIDLPMRMLTTLAIPQIKVAAFRDLFSSQMRIKARELTAGTETKENVARLAWRDVEDRFGLINYDNEFWNRTLKTSMMVMVRAPGWTMGTLRGLSGAYFVDLPRFAARATLGRAPEWTPRMSYALSVVFTTMALGAIYFRAHTGKNPETLEDYLSPKNGQRDEHGKPIRISFPTHLKDINQWTTDPVKAAVGRINTGKGTSAIGHGGKLAPEVTLAMDLLTNQYYRGPIRNVNDPAYKQAGQVLWYLFNSEEPFSIQQAKELSHGKAAPLERVEAFFGMTRRYPQNKRRRERFRYHLPE